VLYINHLRTDLHPYLFSVQAYYTPDALPIIQPTISKHWRKLIYIWVQCNIFYIYQATQFYPFSPHDAMLAQYTLSSCVQPSVRHKPVLYRNG